MELNAVSLLVCHTHCVPIVLVTRVTTTNAQKVGETCEIESDGNRFVVFFLDTGSLCLTCLHMEKQIDTCFPKISIIIHFQDHSD